MSAQPSLSVVILAGGKGTRMHSSLPKVLHCLAGKSLLQHVVEMAQQLNPQTMIGIFGHGGDQVPATISGDAIQWCLQQPQLGTGHALQMAAPHLPDTGATLVLYGDVPLLSVSTARALLGGVAEGCVGLLTQVIHDPTGYGRILRDAEGRVAAIVEHKDATPAEREIDEVNTGIMVLPNARLKDWLARLRNDNVQGEYYLTDVIGFAVAEGVPVHTAHPTSDWETLGVNNKVQLAALERQYQLQIAHQLMTDGVTLADPARLDVRGTLQAGQDVQIDVGCVFSGQVSLGNGVQIGPYCVISDCTIADHTHIAAYSHLQGAAVGADARVGPFARLRPGAVLGDAVHIGNFVEVKNAALGKGSKANHLSYLGDATIGRNVNIGAGTITCNYDGVNKHRTVIEDDVQVGSDVQLIAPVTIGAGATIAAGTTVWRDAPASALSLNPKTQLANPAWARPSKK